MASRILVIDDERSILDLFRTILEPEGYTIHLSQSASEALSAVEHVQPDLIILDMKLGQQNDGMLLLQQLKSYPPTKDIPLLLCTAALNKVREHEETLRQQDIPVLSKPFDIDELLHQVEQLLCLRAAEVVSSQTTRSRSIRELEAFLP